MLDQLINELSQAMQGEGAEGMPDTTMQEEAPDPKKTAVELQQRFQYADSYRKQFDDKATAWYKLYVGYRDTVANGRSNLHIPRAYEQLDTLRARLVKSFVSTRPYIEFIPRIKPRMSMEDVEDNERKADIAAALVDLQMDKNKMPSRFYDYVTSMLVFPAGILGVGWRYDEKRVRRKEPIMMPVMNPQGFPEIDWEKAQPLMDPSGQPVVDPQTGQPMPDPATLQPLMQVVGMQVVETDEVAWDDNEIVNIDFYDFWPDPRGNDVDDCRFVFHREWMTSDQIDEKLALLENAGSGHVYPIDWETMKETGGGLEEGKWERLSAVGISPETQEGNYEADTGNANLFEVLNYWEDERYAILINRKEVAYDGANPYWRHSKKPFVVTSFEQLPGEFYGMSAMQIIEHLQEEMNTHRNQRIDNISMIINRMWKVRRGADIDESELVSRPHGIIHVDNPDDVSEFIMHDITGSAYNEEQIAKMDMENSLAVPSVVRGVDSARSETATEIVTKSTNAGMRFDIKIMLFETLGFKRLAMLMDLNNQQFIDDERLIRLVGEEGADQWQAVNPWEIIGEFDYRPAGANVDPAANKEVRREQLVQLLNIAMSSQSPYVNVYELWKSLISSFDLRNTDKLLKTQEEVQQEQYEQMVMAQKAQMEAAQQQQMEQQQAMQEQQMQQQEAEQQQAVQQLADHSTMHQLQG